MITLVIGGARSGKSAVAERLAADASDEVVYVATGVPTDPDMAARIEGHRARRPPAWLTVETADLPRAVADHPGRVLLVDSIGTWVASSPDLGVDVDGLVTALVDHDGLVVVVSEEVGMGVHPETEVGRRFRDVVGDVNRRIGEIADDVLLVVAGRVLRLP